MFRDGDLLYIFSSLVDVASKVSTVLERHFIGLFRANKVYLSTEGYIKIYPFRLMAQSTNSSHTLE